MKKLLFVISCILAVEAYAQPSINSTHMPQNGDTLRYSIALPDSAVLASFNTAGANQNWQFGNLIPRRQVLAEYVASSQTPYNVSNRIGQLLADSINLGGTTIYDVYDFFDNNSNEFALDYRGFSIPNPLPFGPSLITQNQQYSDKDEIYQFPLNYLDRDSSTFDFLYTNNLAGVRLRTLGYRINEVEGWGIITTPYGTFPCIKVRTDVVSNDTVRFGTTNIGISNHLREYKWLSPQLRDPVANLSGNVIGGVFIPQDIQYRDSARTGLGSIFAPLAFFNADTTIINVGDSLQFNNNSVSLTPATYQWSISPSTHAYINGTSSTSEEPVVQYNAAGFYDVQLVAQNTNGNDTLLLSNYIEVRLPTSLSENQKSWSLQIFPNPLISGGEMIIESETNIGQIWLYDQQSRLVANWRAKHQQSVRLNLEKLETGLYFLQIDLNGDRITKKVIIQ